MKILFVVDKYYPKPFANVICSQKIVDKLVEEGHSVRILSFLDPNIKGPEVYNGCKVDYIKTDLKTRLFYNHYNNSNKLGGKISYFFAKLFSVSKKILFLRYFPLSSLGFPRRISKKIMKLNDEDKYDMVVTVVHPFEGAYALYRASKKKKLDFKWIVLMYDNLDNPSIKKIFKKSNNLFWTRRFIKYCDGIMYMKSRKDYYQIPELKQYENKLIETDIPLLTTVVKKTDSNYFHNDAENWCYFGSLSSPHYNPHFLIEFFLSLPENKKRVLHFYCRGNNVPYVREMASKHIGKIIVNDYVEAEKVLLIEQSSDVLVSIKSSNNISAKVFEYFSTNNYVIHISGCAIDPNCDYVERYSKGFVIKENELSISEWIKKYLEFTNQEEFSESDEKEFKMNKPDYSVRKLIDFLNNYN